jgi:hypothetical protein
MTNIDDELDAAKASQYAISVLVPSTLSSDSEAIVILLRDACLAATNGAGQSLSSY